VIALRLAFALLLAAAPAPVEPARLAAPREPSVGGELLKGRVSSVHDADTITVRLSTGTEKVRLVGIDSPELGNERADVRAFGLEARDYARSRVDGVTVTLEADSKQPDRDKYGRLLRYVILGDGTNLNEELVRKGYARVYDRFSFDLKRRFKQAEAEAKRESLGLWRLSPAP